MIIVYTGPGKGKTSSCVGQAVRALGQDLRVAFGQFMKRPEQAGEQKILKQLLGDNFLTSGEGFFRDGHEKTKHRNAAVRLLQWAEKRIPHIDMLILDETLYALGAQLITQKETEDLFDLASKHTAHVVLSGRNLPDWLERQADLVSYIVDQKHPYSNGQKACRGIEY